MSDLDLSIVFKERRFRGVRIGLAGFVIAGIAFGIAQIGWLTVGCCVFVIGWLVGVAGFFVHLTTSGWRGR
jgi:hypothetical protein